MTSSIQIPSGLPPWRAVLFDGHSVGFAEATDTIFRVAIEPSCSAIASQLAANPRGKTDESINRWESLRIAQLELHRSFAMALGGLWERNFRAHLWHSAAAILDKPTKSRLDVIERGDWNKLLNCFERVRNFPLTKFPTYPDLELLYHLTSAIRHGNGPALKGIFDNNREMFLSNDVRIGWFSYFTLGGEPEYSINKLEIEFENLVHFKDAIVGFWLLVRALQASSEI